MIIDGDGHGCRRRHHCREKSSTIYVVRQQTNLIRVGRDDHVGSTCRPVSYINGVFGLMNELIYYFLTLYIFIWFVK
jgi:hypothetical protein